MNLTVKTLFAIFTMMLNSSSSFAQTVQAEAIPNESSISYTLSHPLHEMHATSKEVFFHIEADTSKKIIKSVSAQVDVMTFDSGNSNRDSHAMEAIDALTYPDVTFKSTAIHQNGDSLAVEGNLSFHGVTNNISMNGSLKWSSSRIDARGNFNLSLTAFNIDRPSLLMIAVNDTLHFTIMTALRWE
jgi:polyisoprenoid-binding protein YceI